MRLYWQWEFDLQLHQLLLNKQCVVIGDSRYTRWWDLGQCRIQQGANQAIMDGWDLAAGLMTNAVANASGNDNETSDWTHNVLDKFQVRTMYRYASTISCRWVVLALIAIWVAIVMNRAHTDWRLGCMTIGCFDLYDCTELGSTQELSWRPFEYRNNYSDTIEPNSFF